jgi:hypothetical protein
VQGPCSRSEAVSTRGTIDPFAYHKPLLARRSEPYVAKEAMMHEINSSLMRRRHCGVTALNCRPFPGFESLAVAQFTCRGGHLLRPN